MKEYKIDTVNAILRLYGRIYDELYDDKYRPLASNSLGVDPEARPYDIEEAGVDCYEGRVRGDKNLMDLVGACAKQRRDCFVSDREVSALAWTLDELGVLE